MDALCTEITVRYTAFSILAVQAKNRDEYQSYMYKLLLNGDADKDTKELLLKLVDVAWQNRGKDVVKTSMEFYTACAKGEDV
jgi:hypothetical protein